MGPVLGGDVSKYQDNNATVVRPDFKKAKAAGWRFVLLRYSGAYQVDKRCFTDEDLDYNYKAIQDAGMPVGAFHYHSFSVAPATQVNYFGELLEKYPPSEKFGVWGDFECPYLIPADPGSHFLQFMNGLSKWKRGVYTRASYWNKYGTQSSLWKAFDLWVAHYGVTKPAIPLPWAVADFWQYTSSGDAPQYGMEYTAVDLDWCLNPVKYGLVADPVLTMEQKVEKLWAAHPGL